MLIELAIKNFAIIDDIRISFSKGLSILTGETGAGKSIIIEAFNLLLGGRASADLVRSGEKHAELEATFLIDPESTPARIMRDNDFEPSESLKIRRIITSNGRHKIYINSRQSTIQLLKLVTENLASISSQHAHQGLLNEDNHLDILDTFAGTWSERKSLNSIYDEIIPLIKKLASFKANAERITEENEFLRFQINEIEQADIKPQEDEILEVEKNRLKNGSFIYEAINFGINEIYSNDGSILEKLVVIKSNFEKYAGMDNSLSRGADVLSKTILELEDLVDDLRRSCDSIELDPYILEKTQSRLDLIQKLKRKYGGTGGSLDDLFRKYNSLKEKISNTDNVSEQIKEMEEKIQNLSEQIKKIAVKLSEKRTIASTTLAHLAENELKSLEMENARFEIAVKQTKTSHNRSHSEEKSVDERQKESYLFAELSLEEDMLSNLLSVDGMKIYATGVDKVSFLMSPNPGEPPKQLNKIASGGELSRVVLALKAVLSENEPQATLVFDEVDSGIGGRTSDKVGIKLQQLSEKYQLLCITHLAQIAKYGTTHYKIQKKVNNNRTSTSITPLIDQEDRVKELARMMGGTNISQATIDHAADMIKTTIR